MLTEKITQTEFNLHSHSCRSIKKNLPCSCSDAYELKMPDPDGFKEQQLIVLFHYAMRVWQASHHGTYHIYGHSHGELPDDLNALSFDVGVDCHNYAPINYQDIKNIMKNKNWTKPLLREG